MPKNPNYHRDAHNSLRASGARGAESSNSLANRWHKSAEKRFEDGLAPITLPTLKFLEA